MAANAFALHQPLDEREGARWGASAAMIVALHLGAALLAMNWLKQVPDEGVNMPAILIDMTPETSAPQSTPLDIAPGPMMQQADASPPEPVQQQAVEEMIPPTPPQERPEVLAPPEQKLEPSPPQPEPAKVVPVEKPAPAKPKAVRLDARKPSDALPAPRTSAPPRTERQAPLASAVNAGSLASAMATYYQRVRAHLMRFHQYPTSANGQRGVVKVSFTLGRNGQVLSSRLGGSSGVAALDAQAMAMVRQAQPFPPVPAEISYATIPINVPVIFGK
ncbi:MULTISPECIES: energy transducer TonB [unclassified Bradyrhizobium]|uniref:energy transducer TonB family protein n=1 Tax=Bradyrhizobium TaxID=374 RepID=UPI001CD58B92|nr:MULTISPECIES: energy transducer TonB [unclassified Bradyrhizobium]MCA1374513.1 energy transducer TonB [Bradyrhizobium sp. IC4060]MCA1475656.1 energy transducer TonB [Bradyrhizobium sp. NBAIM08]MCA1488500.1 energy transducer TonB [Bradyrhizobium sp. IC4061]MCA1495678.1 energy transducer TonB [Bradyrhizobium sp. NBAIM14]MCA1540868.1 energy transducer TonB [Bradyrhizobium sp. NBAIM32]